MTERLMMLGLGAVLGFVGLVLLLGHVVAASVVCSLMGVVIGMAMRSVYDTEARR